MLLEQGALCERDTFQGERCLYNALNDRIRNLLLSYDYSKSTDPLQPLAAHITSLLTRETPKTADIAVYTGEERFDLHKFVLSAKSPYFAKKLAAAPETTSWRLSSSVPPQSFETCIRYLYIGEVSADLGDGEEEQAILTGIEKLSRQLEVPQLFENILHSGDRRQARQRRTEELERSRDQLTTWFKSNVLRHKLEVDCAQAASVKWDRDNGIFADVLLRADDEEASTESELPAQDPQPNVRRTEDPLNGIPIGHFQTSLSRSSSRRRKPRRSVLYPVHRAMLLRSEVFATMFASPFREGQETTHLQIVPVDCAPDVLEVILTFLYTEKADFPLALALDVLQAADMLFIEKLKQRAALLISTLGNGSASVVEAENPRGEIDVEAIVNIYDVVRAGWDTRVHRLEEFGARYIAYRLERYIDEPDFRELVQESANRIQGRQETDTVELVDDIRYYLSERFRLRFEDAGLDDMLDEQQQDAEVQNVAHGAKEDEGYGGSPAAGVVCAAPPGDDPNAVPAETFEQGVVRTLDGEVAGDEFAQDAINYQILLGKIDRLMENLGLDG
nr:btb/poz domain-containing protein 3 [Quercus suber]